MFEKYEWTQCNYSLFPGFYESVLSGNWVNEHYTYVNDGEEYDFPDEKSYKEYAQNICKDFVYEIQQRYIDVWFGGLDKVIKNMKFKRLISPQYYNFETDRLVIECEIDKWKILRYIFNNKWEFEKYLRKNYTSCSGFISFVENSLAGILKQPRYFWNVALDFIFLQETNLAENVNYICEELVYKIAPKYIVCTNEDAVLL